jgi:hypothetical protein
MSAMRLSRRVAVILATAVLLAGTAVTGKPGERMSDPDRERMPVDPRGGQELIGGAGTAAKAQVDTIYLIGGPDQLSGKFELADHVTPDPQGWYGVDLTSHAIPRWQISPFNAANLDPGRPGNNAMWCGETFAAGCGGDDVPEGYSDYYDDWLDWRGTVPNNAVTTTVRVTAILNLDSEPDYDFLGFEVETATGMTSVGADLTGAYTGFAFDRTVSVGPANYVGAGHDEVHLRWRATSDSGYSDDGCLFPSSGFAQVDNVSVFFDGVLQTADDFETGNPVHWVNAAPPAVGNFAKVWPRLFDIDACNENPSPQWAFIDDGVVVPGTGGSLGQSWTYGPGGFVVNTTGGLAGPTYGLHTEAWSPPIDWPAGHDGGSFRWDQYSDQKLATGLFPVWHIRSSANGGTTWGPWDDDNTIYYGGLWWPNYYRAAYDLRRYLVPGCNKVQIALGVWEYWPLDYLGTDSTPAPYFDNVALLAWPIGGPTISAEERYLFNDGWPEAATIDYADLAKDSVRLDMASNISPRAHLRNDPGDSIVVTVKPLRAGSVLNGRPELHVLMKANPLFDGVRTNVPAGFTRTGSLISGVVAGDTVRAGTPPTVKADLWKWDLPDTGFFFPGDMLHYYIKAQDNRAGDIGTSYLPADTTGFSLFPGQRGYRSGQFYEAFKVDALPSMISATAGDQPHLLFWDDSQGRANQDEWLLALDNLGYRQNVDYDIYCNYASSSGMGNGLGGRTNALKMSGYTTMLYTPANLMSYTIANGDPAGDPGNDLAVVDAWLASGGKNLFATGDNIIQDLSASGTLGTDFVAKWFGVTLNSGNLRPLISGQLAPTVKPITVAGAPVLPGNFIVQGGCDGGINDFDAITAIAPAVRIAEFLQPNGTSYSGSSYAAAVYNNVTANTAQVVFMPYDLSYIWSGTTVGGKPARAVILQTILSFFGHLPGGAAVGVTPDAVFSARNYPNPFNPSTKIEFTLPRAGQVELKIYNVRGELVKTLLDQNMAAATHAVVWDGRDTRGQAVSSGVYFYSLKAGDDEKMVKMTLVR